MKSLVICQPHAFYIFADEAELKDGDVPKRVENRTWACDYRGALLIIAGKNKSWLKPGDEAKYPQMLFGYALGTVDLVACIPVKWKAADEAEAELPPRFRWCARHQHAGNQGYWWVMENVRRFSVPVPARGQQGLFDLPGDWEEKRTDAKPAAALVVQPRQRQINLES